ILVLNEDTTASIGAGATANAQTPAHTPGDSNLTVTASDTTSIVSVAGSVGIGGTAGVAAGVDVLSLIKHTNAYIDSGVTAHVDGDIAVGATSHEEITSVAAATVTVDTKHTQAFIGNGASVTGDGKTSGVSVKSGGFNTGFVADTPKASVSFDPVSNVNTTNDTIHIAGSGLSAGDYVTYH